jgi:hypothetical protein
MVPHMADSQLTADPEVTRDLPGILVSQVRAGSRGRPLQQERADLQDPVSAEWLLLPVGGFAFPTRDRDSQPADLRIAPRLAIVLAEGVVIATADVEPGVDHMATDIPDGRGTPT